MTSNIGVQNKFLRNTGKIVFSKFILVILKAALGILTARAFGPAGKGLFVLSGQIPGFFTMFSNLSLGEALTVHISQGKIGRREMFGTFLVLFLLISGTTTIIYYATLPYAMDWLWKVDDSAIPFWSGLIIPMVVGEYFALFSIRGARQYNLYLSLSLSAKVVSLLMLSLAWWIYDIDVLHGILVYIGTNLVFTVLNAVALWNISERTVQCRKENIVSTLRYGITIHPSVLLSDMEYRFDIYLLAFYLQPAAIGIYSVAVTLAQLSWYFTNSVNTIFLPELGVTDDALQAQRTALICRNTFFITFLANVLLLLCGYPLVTLFYGGAFAASYFAMCLLLPGILFDSCFRILSSYYKNKFSNALLNKYSLFSLLLNIALNTVLIPHYGIYGAAVSSALSYSSKGLLISFAFARDCQIPFRELILIDRNDRVRFWNVLQTLPSRFRQR